MEITTKFLSVCLLAVFVFGEPGSKDENLLSQKCLNCLCVASSGCNKNPYWDGNVCGPYRISLGYWLDAGSPGINKTMDTYSEQSFINCANNLQCASRAVEGYMKRYKRDCDGDGKIDCDDFARIHHKGPRLCSLPLGSSFKQDYEKCMKK